MKHSTITIVAALVAMHVAHAAAQQPAQKKPSAVSQPADCGTQLKSGDSFKELTAILQCLEGRIRTLEAATSPPTSKKSAALQPPPSADGRSLTKDGISILLVKCERYEGSLNCHYRITNTGSADKRVCFGEGSRIVSEAGEARSESYFRKIGSARQLRNL